MEFFNKAKAIRLKSHLEKYLVADDDEHTIRQSRNGAAKKARWIVELVEGNPHAIRLKGCHGKYLTASDEAFLLGMTGKKVVQTNPGSFKDAPLEWEPIKEGYKVKLRTKGGKFLRANGATPPWRNSVTHDLPNRTATQDWVLWEVDLVDISVLDDQYLPSGASSFSSLADEDCTGPNTRSPSISTSVTYESRSPSITHGSYSPRIASESRALSVSASESRKPSGLSQKRWVSVASNKSEYSSGRQDGMQFFDKAKAIRLQSHLGKYLVADDNEETVRQSRNGASHKARWTVEFVEGKNAIRLKSCHGKYLTATEEPFLLGMTGKKVAQTLPADKTMDSSIEWEPVKEGLYVKLLTREGKYLRANGGTPPWRNSITHDVPHRTATQNWVLWGVEVVDILAISNDSESIASYISPQSSFSSLTDDYTGSPDTGSPMVQYHSTDNFSMKQVSGMELFKKAKSVRLKSHHDKYLRADSDEETVIQDRHGSVRQAKWTVEFVEGVDNVIRLKSCYGRYLTATDEQYLLGVTGRKVIQSLPRKLDSSIEWEPLREGMLVRLKTRYGNYLRANGGLPPWRNSITHDIPHRHHDWVLWEVDVIEIRPESPPKVARSESINEDLSCSSFHLTTPTFSNNEVGDGFGSSPAKSEGRVIYYNVADDKGKVDDAVEGPSFHFKGHTLEELTQKLEEETGLENIIVCSRNRINGKLYPLRLALPPNNATMHIVVVPSTSRVAREFMPESTSSK